LLSILSICNVTKVSWNKDWKSRKLKFYALKDKMKFKMHFSCKNTLKTLNSKPLPWDNSDFKQIEWIFPFKTTWNRIHQSHDLVTIFQSKKGKQEKKQPNWRRQRNFFGFFSTRKRKRNLHKFPRTINKKFNYVTKQERKIIFDCLFLLELVFAGWESSFGFEFEHKNRWFWLQQFLYAGRVAGNLVWWVFDLFNVCLVFN
jgi:hypothetical protein